MKIFSTTLSELFNSSMKPLSVQKNLKSTYSVQKLQCIKFGETILDSLNLNKSEITIDKLDNDQVFLKLVASSINPADIFVIQGKYGHLPKLPETIGIEGLFEVVKSGCTESFKEGDWAVVKSIGMGTWTSHLLAHKNDLIRMDKRLSIESAATMLVNPVSAYLMLHNFVKLSKGESVIINAPTSTVGKALIQICKGQYLKSVCILRDDQMKNQTENLKKMGATFVLSNSDLLVEEKCADIPKSRLALNCVGGKHATDMMRLAAEHCTMVTYGDLSSQPLSIPAGSFIFNDHRFMGFWLATWCLENQGNALLEEVIGELTQLALEGKLEPPQCKKIPLVEYKEAFSQVQTRGRKEKILLVA